jgi:hypothetical protein
MRNLRMSVTVQGPKGDKNKTIWDRGYAQVTAYKEGREVFQIFVDTFEGSGKTYKERDEPEIFINFGDGTTQFRGTAAQLKQLLTTTSTLTP